MSIKNTPVQVLEDCGIIFLFKEELCRSPDLYRFADPLRCWEHRGGFFVVWLFLDTIKISFDFFNAIVFTISIHTLKTCTRRN